MWMQSIQGAPEKLTIDTFLTEENDVPEVNNSKGFPLRYGIAVSEDGVKHFIKFVLCGECSSKSLQEAETAFSRELKFQMRYPYIIYVEKTAFYELHVDEEDRRKPAYRDFLFSFDRVRKEEETAKVLLLMEEMAEGERLLDVYDKSRKPVPVEIMFRHMYQLINGMCAYYNRYRKDPLLHRDIKPANIIISKDGKTVKYIDFDIAHPSGSSRTMNAGGFFKGTPGYAHPRQTAAGAGASDIRIDLYELGMTFLYMLTGEDYIRSVCGLNDQEMNNWSYIFEPSVAPYLHQINREKLFRNGEPVYREKKYKELLDLIDRMIARDSEKYNRTFGNPEKLAELFEKFLRNFFGSNYREVFGDEELLSDYENSRSAFAAVQFQRIGGDSRTLTIGENSVTALSDQGEIGILYMTGDKVYVRFTVQNTVLSEDALELTDGQNALTRRPCNFKIGNREYRLKLISIRK